MEERSSIASVQHTNNGDQSEMKSKNDKIKGYSKIQPYMKTQVDYFKRSNPNRKSKNGL